MASLSTSASASVTSCACPWVPTFDQGPFYQGQFDHGPFDSAAVGITEGYTGDSLPIKIVMSFFYGLAFYNVLELFVLLFVTFQRYHGLYFWSLLISSIGVIPYSLGFMMKFFRLVDQNTNVVYVPVALLTVGWYAMVTGQSVVLWSRLHLVTQSRRTLRWTLYMIITNAILLHISTTILTFGSNSNSLNHETRSRFVKGYSITETIQLVGFFLQELILSVIYIRETLKLLKSSANLRAQGDDAIETGHLRSRKVRKTMYELVAINVIIIAMDLVLLGIQFADLYLVQTTVKGAIYSIKLKLEYAVLGKLVQLVRNCSLSSSDPLHLNNPGSRSKPTTTSLEKSNSKEHGEGAGNVGANPPPNAQQHILDSIGSGRVIGDMMRADVAHREEGSEMRTNEDTGGSRRRARVSCTTWINEEIDKHNIE